MTLETFLEKLEQTPRDWSIGPSQMIRRQSQCPISSLNGYFACAYEYSAKALGIDKEMATEIALAADAEQDPTSERGRLRAKLLKACGLEAT